MFDEQSKQQLAATVRTAQIILAALAMGVVMFGLVVVFGMPGGQEGKGNTLTLLAVCFAGADLVLCLLVPNLVVAAQRRKLAAGTWQAAPSRGPVPDTDAGKLAMIYQMKMIIGAAMLEGGCFLALTAYMVERQVPSLVMAAVLLAALLAHFPTYGRVAAWIEEQLRRVEEERRFSNVMTQLLRLIVCLMAIALGMAPFGLARRGGYRNRGWNRRTGRQRQPRPRPRDQHRRAVWRRNRSRRSVVRDRSRGTIACCASIWPTASSSPWPATDARATRVTAARRRRRA